MTQEEINKLAIQLNTNAPQTDLTKKFIERSQKIKDIALNANDLSVVKSLVERDIKVWIERIFTYQHDYKNITFNNGDANLNTFIKKYNFQSYMTLKHAQANRVKNAIGKVAYFIKPKQGKAITEIMEIVDDPEIIDDEIVSITLTKNLITMINEKNYMEVYCFTKFNGVVTIKSMNVNVNNKKDTIGIDETIISGMQYIPVVIDYANEMGNAEWKNIMSSIDFYSTFEQKVQREFEYLKVSMLLNPQYTDKTAKQLQKEIEDGNERILVDYNDNASQALNMLTNGGVTSDIARSIRDDYKETIKEQLFLIAQSSGKNNKHTNETTNDNIYAYCYAWFKKNLYSETLSRLYWMIIDISNKVANAQINLPEYLECDAQLARPLEIALNLNANGEEQDAPTTTSIREDTVTTIDKGGK